MKHYTIERNTTYTNNDGQAKEQSLRYAVTGKLEKADNRPATECADLGNIQIKSARATVCLGTTAEALDRHLATDKAERYAYITKDYEVYEMSKEEYRAFVLAFHIIDHDSAKNGGRTKMRLRKENKAMIEYLRAAAE